MNPMAMADRTAGDQDSAPAACMTAAIAKQPARFTTRVPYGNVVPKRWAVHRATRYRVPVPAAPARQIQMNRSMSRHLWVPRHREARSHGYPQESLAIRKRAVAGGL